MITVTEIYIWYKNQHVTTPPVIASTIETCGDIKVIIHKIKKECTVNVHLITSQR